MALRIDWQKIKAVWPTDETVILTMSRRAASVLLSVMGNLEYRATFREANYDYSDWDDLQAILSDADYELGAAMPLTELIQYIDEVEGLLRVIRDRTGCCPGESDPTGGDYYTDDVVDGVDNVPQNIIDAGYATDANDWAGFDDYKCMISHVFVESQAQTCYELSNLLDDVGTIAGGIVAVVGVIGAFFASGGTALFLGILGSASLAATLYEKLTEQNDTWMDDLGDKVIVNKDDLACAVYNGDGTNDSLADYEAKVDELFTVTEATILKLFNQKALLKALYAGRYDQQNIAQILANEGYDVLNYDCTCLQESGLYVANAPSFSMEISDDNGQTWTPLSNGNYPIVYGVEYLLAKLSGATYSSNIVISDAASGGSNADIQASNVDWPAPAGNCMYWSYDNSDGNQWNNNYRCIDAGDYPFSWAKMWSWNTSGNTVSRTYPIKITFQAV